MISFYGFVSEISGSNLPQIQNNSVLGRFSKLSPDSGKFNIIPIKIGYDTYNVLKNYSGSNSKFNICDNLLNRRGESMDWKNVYASNEEIVNLKELANHILKTSQIPNELSVANVTLKTISNLESESSTS
jgi:hypothetical protein